VPAALFLFLEPVMHLSPELGMAAVAICAGVLNLRNVIRLHKDRRVAGLCPWTIAFYTAANFWNLYYWGTLGQWVAVIAGVPMATLNFLWVCMAAYYSRQHRPVAEAIPAAR
jgi:hypothetical protein